MLSANYRKIDDTEACLRRKDYNNGKFQDSPYDVTKEAKAQQNQGASYEVCGGPVD